MRTTSIRLLLGGVVLIVAILVFSNRGHEFDVIPEDLHQAASKQYRSLYNRDPKEMDLFSMAGEIAVARQDYEIANKCFAQIPSDHSQYGASARLQQAQVLLKLNLPSQAELQLREFLKLNSPHRLSGQQFLRYLLEIELRFEERHRLLAVMHQEGDLTPQDAIFYGFSSLLRWNGEVAVDRCQEFYRAEPVETDVAIAWAHYLGGTARASEGLEIVDSVLSLQPRNLRAVGVKAFLLSELGEDADLSQLLKELSEPQKSDPWLLLRMRGRWAYDNDELKLAEQCYQLYLSNDVSFTECYVVLAKIAAKIGETEKQQAYLESAQTLAIIQNRLGGAQFSLTDEKFYVELAELSHRIGLRSQTELMAKSALQINPESQPARDLLAASELE